MLARIVAKLTFALVLVQPLAQAETLGDSVNVAIGPAGAAALADMPPEVLGALHASSTLLAARAQGLVSDRDAALALVVLADQLTDARPRLNALDADAFRIALILEVRVLSAGARELLLTMVEGPERADLFQAMARLTESRAAGIERRLHAGSDGPDNPCFQEFHACMHYCSELDDFFQRALCGLDCEIDLAVCLGKAVRLGAGGLISVIDLVDGVTG